MRRACNSILVALLVAGACTDAPQVLDAEVEPDTLSIALSIGAIDSDGHDAFGRITGIAADASGRIFVLDGQNHEVRVFDQSGAFQFRFGRSGSGPGELSDPCCMAWGPEGDLWIRDGGNGRYSVFAVRDGGADLLRTIRLLHADVGRPYPTTFRGGTEFADIGASTPRSGGERVLNRHWRTLEGDPVETEAIQTPTVEQLGGQLFDTGRGVRYYLYQPYGPSDLTAFGPDGLLAVGTSSEYAIEVRDGVQPHLLTRAFVTGPALSEAEREAGGERLGVLAKRIGGDVSALPFGLPDRKPPVEATFFDQRGRLWVEISTPDGEMRVADVWDRNGELTHRYVWPADVSLNPYGWLSDEAVLGVRRDELGVEYVVRMSGLAPPGPD